MGKMTHMERNREEETKVPSLGSHGSDYPYGLCISFSSEELEKLGLSHEDFDVDDIIHLAAFGKVTSVSHSKNSDNENSRIEVQLTHLNLLENESEEEEHNREPETRPYW